MRANRPVQKTDKVAYDMLEYKPRWTTSMVCSI